MKFYVQFHFFFIGLAASIQSTNSVSISWDAYTDLDLSQFSHYNIKITEVDGPGGDEGIFDVLVVIIDDDINSNISSVVEF